jgi:DnaK suppressor protein
MKKISKEAAGFKQILERKESELVRVLRKRDGIAIEKSADQMDEIQYASERELAIRNADLKSNALRQVRAAMQRIDDGSFGICIACDLPISPKRLAALPWAPRCIRCQEVEDRNRGNSGESARELLVSAA